MSKFNYFLLIILVIAIATFLVSLYLDDRGKQPAEEPAVRTEEPADVRQP